jgi:hypothetical protein
LTGCRDGCIHLLTVSRFDALAAHLRAQKGGEVTTAFDALERVAGASLPPEAQHSDAWWSNLAQTAGFSRAEVDRQARAVIFKRTGLADKAVESKGPEPEEKQNRHPSLGALKGTFTIKPGVDLHRRRVGRGREVYRREVGSAHEQQAGPEQVIRPLTADSFPGTLEKPAHRVLAVLDREHGFTVMTRDKALLDYGAEGHLAVVEC